MGAAHSTPVTVIDSNIPYPSSFSQFGHMVNVVSGESKPISQSAVFFTELFGYTASKPRMVYEELIDAFRLQRIIEASGGQALGPAPPEFAAFMEKVNGAGILPNWWQENVHGQEILKFTEGDEWARLDRVVDREAILAHHNPDGKKKPEMRLRMIAERVYS